jgi:hypothetical protein
MAYQIQAIQLCIIVPSPILNVFSFVFNVAPGIQLRSCHRRDQLSLKLLEYQSVALFDRKRRGSDRL